MAQMEFGGTVDEDPRIIAGEVVPKQPQTPINDNEVHRITSARTGTTAAQRYRTRRYLISMGIRTACFLLAVGVWALGAPAWIVWVLAIGATILPYFAVVMANAGTTPDKYKVDPVPPLDLRSLPNYKDGLPGPESNR